MSKTNLKNKPFEFSDLRNAQNFANRCNKLHMVVLGDNEKFWVVLPVDYTRLLNAGYEAAV